MTRSTSGAPFKNHSSQCCNRQRGTSITREQRQLAAVRADLAQVEEYFEANPLLLNEEEARYLLHELCVELGYSLPPHEHRQILMNPPTTPGKFVVKVMEAEGVGSGDPEMAGPVHDRVRKVFLRVAFQREKK